MEDDMIVYIDNPKDCKNYKVSGFKVNIKYKLAASNWDVEFYKMPFVKSKKP